VKLCKTKNVMSWFFQIVVAVILFQTLFFKFTGAAESKFIFSSLGIEPWGRIAAAIVELIAGVLLLMPRTAVVGAALALVAMASALCAHFTKLGLIVQDDGGLLFLLAITVFVCSALILGFRRAEMPVIGRHFSNPRSCQTEACSPH